jgi:hypothetical protein
MVEYGRTSQEGLAASGFDPQHIVSSMPTKIAAAVSTNRAAFSPCYKVMGLVQERYNGGALFC